jgi:membrane-bound lytic murein transglycosylase D
MIKGLPHKLSVFFQRTKKYWIAFTLSVILLSVIKLFSYSVSDFISDSDYDDYFNSSYKVLSIHIPKNINFAGEKVPIKDLTVRKAIERELTINTYWQSHSLLLHKKANRWFPVIEPILKANDIPNDFKYIALVESQLTNATSPQGAVGFWQIVEPTARQYGLEITNEVDERYDVVKSTQAACKYFKEAYKQFNDWTLVAASYNRGMGGMQSALNKQKVDNYYDLLLTEETARYIYRLLSMKEIISRPKVYGYILRKKDLYPAVATKKIQIDSSITNLAEFAVSQNINYTILKTFNPWLLSNSLTNPGKKKYIIEIPKGSVNIFDLEENHEGSNSPVNKDTSENTIPQILVNDSIKKEEGIPK